ncbi:MAG: hypothetical protein A2W35_20430 [Chloroflexi bacterium RBG_16_57_11]|nr:MAG: hypothetical protein A2W35_20430 [Chloroflexi bacterium RBG_16_57_11]
MITKLVITDLTRMQHGRVCVAGYDSQGRAVRPVLPPPGIPESALYQAGQPVIFPFALVAFDLQDPDPQPPHTEDVRYTPDSPQLVRVVQSREAVLAWSLYESVTDVFGQPVLTGPGYYVLDCQGERSLGTIRPKAVDAVIYAPGDDTEAWDYRIVFDDALGQTYRLKITDLSWQYFCHSLRGESHDPPRIAVELTQTLQERKVYLRLGLSRGWKKYPERCYLQVNGVYTNPDYLEGRTFADFASLKNK